jgi:site-specific DNA recombinase
VAPRSYSTRLSRSLLDFARLMAVFDQRRVSFVSVTQQFNTATSMGRLVLNVLLSFAQFEREIIAERTRDKIAATRRKGKWSGGRPLLGYDLDPRGHRLLVNAAEAEQVRAIFALFVHHQALPPVVGELQRRGWVTKRWRTRAGRDCGGEPFTKIGLRRLLSNALYVGQVRYKDELHDGEHAALVDPAVFGRARALLHRRVVEAGPPALQRPTALLKGLLRCRPCGCAMTPAHAAKGVRRYRYYVCTNAQKRGWDRCPSKSVPAGEIERLVVERLRGLGHDPALLQGLLAQVHQHDEARGAQLEQEQRGLERDLATWQGEVHHLSLRLCPGGDNAPTVARLAELQQRIVGVEARVRKVRAQLRAAREHLLTAEQAATTLALFEPRWETLPADEQARVVGLLVARVEYDGAQGKLSITFQPTGLQTLAAEWAGHSQEERA